MTTKSFTNENTQSLGRIDMTKELVMTKRLHSRYKGRGISTKCFRCIKPIEIGKAYVSKNSCHGLTRLYHKLCWEAMFFEPKEEVILVEQ